jgi:hypothetical protein
MDKAKLRLLAALCGGLFAFAGSVILAFAAVIVLTPVLGQAWATVAVGLVFLALACACLYYFLMPYKAAEEEVHQAEEMAALALADLPFDTVEAIIRRHPVSALTVAVAAGYIAVRDPENASRGLRRLLTGLL